MESARSWIEIMLVVQFLGYAFDAVWHGLVQPGVEPGNVRDMARHLATVHLPLYVGAFGVLVATATAVIQRIRRGRSSGALAIALVGAAISTAAEAWHASSHLRMDTHAAPVVGSLSFVAFVVAAVGTWLDHRQRAPGAIERRRAA